MRLTTKQLKQMIKEEIENVIEARYNPNKALGSAATRLMMMRTKPETDEEILDRIDPEMRDQLSDIYSSGESEQGDAIVSVLDPSELDSLPDYSRTKHKEVLIAELPWDVKGDGSGKLSSKMSLPIRWYSQGDVVTEVLSWTSFTKLQKDGKRVYTRETAMQAMNDLFHKHFKATEDPVPMETMNGRTHLYQKGKLYNEPVLVQYDIVKKFSYEGETEPHLIGKPNPHTLTIYKWRWG